MKNILKVTPIFIALISFCIIYFLNLKTNVWTSFTLFFILLMFICLILIFIFERLIIKFFKSKNVWIFESVFLFIMILMYSFSQSKYYYKINDDVEWFVVILTDDSTNLESKYSFPFDKVANVCNKSIYFLNRNELFIRTPDIKNMGHSKSYTMCKKHWKDIEYVVYEIYPYKLSNFDFNEIEKKIKR